MLTSNAGIGEILTSMPKSLSRIDAHGVDHGDRWIKSVLDSWRSIGAHVTSISEHPPWSKDIYWKQTSSRPSISEILDGASQREGTHILLINSDIVLAPEFFSTACNLNTDTLYIGHRTEVIVSDPEAFLYEAISTYYFGFDYFILPRRLALMLKRNKLLTSMLIGTPWWDYALPHLALSHGFKLVVQSSHPPNCFHLYHQAQYYTERWLKNGSAFLAHLKQEADSPHFLAKHSAMHCLIVSADLGGEEKLHKISKAFINIIASLRGEGTQC